MKILKKFSLNSKDVLVSSTTYSSGLRKKARVPRSEGLREKILILRHEPTGVEIKGSIKLGRYTRKEMNDLEAMLSAHLLIRLEKAVAKFLHIPGL